MTGPVVIASAVEGDLDEAVARRLILRAGGQPGPVYGKAGKAALRAKINAFNHAARRAPWFVLVDLDRDSDCVPPVRAEWLPAPSARLCFRFAVRQVEAWLIADSRSIESFLSVPRGAVPDDPEALENPKLAMVSLARRSRRRDIRTDMLPRVAGGRLVGPAYTSRLIEYVESKWRPEAAAARSDSLRRAIACLERLSKGTHDRACPR